MSKKIQGVHHVAIKPTPRQYKRTVEFYTGLLGFEIKQSWGDPERPCLMVSCGDNSCIEILSSEVEIPRGGPLCHIAFATDRVDELLEEVRAQGYEIKMEPTDTDIGARIAFFYGPVGEEIELFWAK